VLRRVEVRDEEAAHQTAQNAVQEEIAKRQQDIADLTQQQLDTLGSMNKSTPEQAEELGVLLPALAAQISTHTRRVRQLQARRVCRFECTETTETLELPVARWVKIAWCDEPVMFVHPAVGAGSEPVPVLEAVVETAVVTRPGRRAAGRC
jgi:hypothetical protein